MLRIIATSVVALTLAGAPAVAQFGGFQPDWGDCADVLDRLHRDAEDANDAASRAHESQEQLHDCRAMPEVNDLLEDHCESRGFRYRSDVSNLRSKLSSVQDQMDSVVRSCELSFPVRRPLQVPPEVCEAMRNNSGANRNPIVTDLCN